MRTCAGLRRVTRASQLGKCEIISAFCHVPPTCPLPTLPSFPLPSYLPSNHACSLVNPTTASTPITNARRPFHHSARFTDRLLQISSRHPTLPCPPSLPIHPPLMEHIGGDLIYAPSLLLPFFLRTIRPSLLVSRVKSSTILLLLALRFLPNIRFRVFDPARRINAHIAHSLREMTRGVFSRISRGVPAGHEKRVQIAADRSLFSSDAELFPSSSGSICWKGRERVVISIEANRLSIARQPLRDRYCTPAGILETSPIILLSIGRRMEIANTAGRCLINSFLPFRDTNYHSSPSFLLVY